MKILYNRFKDDKQRLIIPIEKYKKFADGSLSPAIAEEPSVIKILIVNDERTEIVNYHDFLSWVETGKLKQIML